MKNRAKIGPESDSKWQRQEKPTKIASGVVSGRPFSPPGLSCKNVSSTFELRKSFFGVFFARAPSGSVPDRFWRLRGLSRTRFFNDFARFFCRFRRDLVVVCRVPPECCRDTPPASGTHSAGFLWGTAILRSELNSPYPTGVLGVLKHPVFAVRKVYPSFPSRRPR